jgi:hypothetical protein
VIAALLLAAAAPAGITLQEALNLPPETLIARALGPDAAAFREVRRPYLGGLPGRIGFNLDFAPAPRPTPHPGLCEVEVLSVYFWPHEGNADPNQAMTEHSRLRYRMYRFLGDPVRMADTAEAPTPPSAATCAAAGPVLSSDDRTGRRTQFFYVGHGGESGISALEVYLSLRTLGAVISGARAGRLPPVDCRGEQRICDNPTRLLARLPLDRFNGFDLVPCGPQTCVEASFSPDPDPNSNLTLLVQIETAEGRFNRREADVSARRIHLEADRVVY